MRKPQLNKKGLMIISGVIGAALLAVAVFGTGKTHILLQKHDARETLETAPVETKIFHVEPPQAPALAFDIALPSDWSVESVTTDSLDTIRSQIIGEVARIGGPFIGVHKPELTVQTLKLEHDIDAATWLRHYILSSSYTPQGAVTADSLVHARGAFTYIYEGKPTLVQAAVHFNGSAVVIARLEIPLSLQDHLGSMQEHAMQTFRLADSARSTVEDQKAYTLADLLSFTYPRSWQLAPPTLADLDRPNIQLFNRNDAGALQGYIQIFVVRRSAGITLEQEADRLRDYVVNAIQLNIEAMTEERALPSLNRFAFARLEGYRVTSTATPNAAAQELRLITLANSSVYAFILMLSPAESVDLYNWGRNKRALELIAQSAE